MTNPPAPSQDWRELISRLIKAEMSRKKLKYEDLSQLLEKHGTRQTAANLRNKINRGILGADLFIQLVYVLNIRSLERTTISDILQDLIDENQPQ